MLVLSRRTNEEIVFPSLDITISVTHCTNKSVRLGIEAPRHIRIVRGELVHHELEPLELDPTLTETRSPDSLGLIQANFFTSEPDHQKTCPKDIKSQVDTIKLAVQLAQTQLNHQRDQRCQDALVHALEAIGKLESTLANAPGKNEWPQTTPASEAVREMRCEYHVGT